MQTISVYRNYGKNRRLAWIGLASRFKTAFKSSGSNYVRRPLFDEDVGRGPWGWHGHYFAFVEGKPLLPETQESSK